MIEIVKDILQKILRSSGPVNGVVMVILGVLIIIGEIALVVIILRFLVKTPTHLGNIATELHIMNERNLSKDRQRLFGRQTANADENQNTNYETQSPQQMNRSIDPIRPQDIVSGKEMPQEKQSIWTRELGKKK